MDTRQAKRLVIFVLGITVLLFGIVMLVAPGPGLLTVGLGLAILASEFLWARRILARFRKEAGSIRGRLLRGTPPVERGERHDEKPPGDAPPAGSLSVSNQPGARRPSRDAPRVCDRESCDRYEGY